MSGIVFVVDDSPIARLLVSRALRTAGLSEIEERESVADATTNIPALACALLDLELPDGDGVLIADALRARQPGLPIAFFTGGAPGHVLVRAQAIGPVFSKPNELDDAIAWTMTRMRAASV